MRKKIVVLSLTVLTMVACNQGVEKAGSKRVSEGKPESSNTGEMMSAHGKAGVGMEKEHGTAKKSRESIVEISDAIKNRWKEAKIFVKDKESGNTEIYTVPLHSDFKIPNSELTVEVGYLVPDFKMGGGMVNSASVKPNNPALQVKILDKEKEVFKGWFFSKYPSTHSFAHPKLSIGLAEEMFEGE